MAANAFQPNEPEALVLDDLASVHLDLAALERGYRRPSGAGYRLTYGREESPGRGEIAVESR